MITQIYGYLWTCDCCKHTVQSHGKGKNNSRPNGWITVNVPTDSDLVGWDYDYCCKCIISALTTQTNNTTTTTTTAEDNHHGRILRYLKEHPQKI